MKWNVEQSEKYAAVSDNGFLLSSKEKGAAGKINVNEAIEGEKSTRNSSAQSRSERRFTFSPYS